LDSPVFALNVDNTGLWISWRAVSHTISKESSLIPPSLVIDPPFFLRLSHFFPQSVTVTHTHFRFAQHHFRGRCFLCGRGGHNSALSPDQAGDLSLGLAIRAARASPHIFNSAKFFSPNQYLGGCAKKKCSISQSSTGANRSILAFKAPLSFSGPISTCALLSTHPPKSASSLT